MDKGIKKDMDKNKSKKTVKKKTAQKKESVSAKAADVKTISDLNGKFLLVRVGTDNRPAESNDIKEIEDKLTALFAENNVDCLAFVTHHAVDLTVI